MRLEVFAQMLAALAASAIMILSLDKRDWSFIDFHRAAAQPSAMLTGGCVGGVAIAGACAVLFAAGLLRFHTVVTDASWIGAALRVTVVLLGAALAEELVCRGYLLSVLRDGLGARVGVAVTSLMFAALHLANDGATAESVAVVMLSGWLLATVRLAFNSLYAAWMAHFAWNWVMAVPLHAPVSGIKFEAPMYEAVTSGPSWVSGGAWGPEGGLVAALGMIGGLWYFYARRRRGEH